MVDVRGPRKGRVNVENRTVAEDAETLRQFSRGDAEAARRFIGAFGGVLRRMAQVLSNEPEDAYQNALVAISRGAGTFDATRAPGGVRPWVLAVARNAMRRRPSDGNTDSGRDSRELAMEDALGIREAFAALRSEDRDVLFLRDVEEFSASEAAEILSISVDALKSRLHRARLRLAAALGDAAPTVRSECRSVGGMSCTEVVDALPALLEGEAPPAVAAAARDHLRGCAVCETFGGRYRSRIERLRAAMGIS